MKVLLVVRVGGQMGLVGVGKEGKGVYICSVLGLCNADGGRIHTFGQ